MHPTIEEMVIERLLLPKKEKLIQKLVRLIDIEIPKLVKNDITIKVVEFIHDDLPFALNYLVLAENQIIDNKYHSNYSLTIDYKDSSADKIIESILREYYIKYENEIIDEDEISEWSSDWQSENKKVEYDFFSDCWIEAKQRTGKRYRAVLYEHECWTKSYELDDKIFIDVSEYPKYLKEQGEEIIFYK